MSGGYVKIFESIYDGTLADNWQAMVTFQQLLILCDQNGIVDMTPGAIHRRTGIPLDIITAGLSVLTAPDPQSRSPLEEGRRIVLLDPARSWGWRLVNHAHYRALMSAADKREADRVRIAEKRKCDNTRHVATTRDTSQASPSVADVAHTEASTDTEAVTTTTEASPTHHATNARGAARGVQEEPEIGSPSTPTPERSTPRGMAVETAIALRKRGVRCTVGHPDLVAAEAEGVTVDAVLDAHDAYPDKPFGYLISTARRQHAERPKPLVVGQPRAGPAAAPIAKTAAAFVALNRIAEGSQAHDDDAIETTATVVHRPDRARLAATVEPEP